MHSVFRARNNGLEKMYTARREKYMQKCFKEYREKCFRVPHQIQQLLSENGNQLEQLQKMCNELKQLIMIKKAHARDQGVQFLSGNHAQEIGENKWRETDNEMLSVLYYKCKGIIKFCIQSSSRHRQNNFTCDLFAELSTFFMTSIFPILTQQQTQQISITLDNHLSFLCIVAALINTSLQITSSQNYEIQSSILHIFQHFHGWDIIISLLQSNQQHLILIYNLTISLLHITVNQNESISPKNTSLMLLINFLLDEDLMMKDSEDMEKAELQQALWVILYGVELQTLMMRLNFGLGVHLLESGLIEHFRLCTMRLQMSLQKCENELKQRAMRILIQLQRQWADYAQN